ncbi:MAG: hypothetical protein ACI3ZR_00235 [bacterium]
MLYVRYEDCNELEILIPIRDDNVYILCGAYSEKRYALEDEYCRRMELEI